MSRFRHLSPWYWVMLGAVVVAGLGYLGAFLFDWMPTWLPLTASLIILAVTAYNFRMLWKQSEPPALRQDREDRKDRRDRRD
jgi:CHASE2 domain-containing sensor protein